MPFPATNRQNFNFPPPLDRYRSDNGFSYTFPQDLVNNDKRKFYTQIEFAVYSPSFQFNSWGSYASPSGGIRLPIPLKVNETFVLNWSETPYLEAAKGAVTSLAGLFGQTFGGIVGGALNLGQALVANPFTGVAVNPLLFLQFQRPEFKEYSLSWVMTPRNEQESRIIRDIVLECKRAAAPTNLGLFMGYPKIALIKMWPDNLFDSIKFKPCVITSVQANYTAAPTPSFHKNGAPTVVTLVLNLKEMQFWFRDEI
jgi:hypothetical protein